MLKVVRLMSGNSGSIFGTYIDNENNAIGNNIQAER